MRRRTFLTAAAATAASPALPRPSRAQGSARVLRFVPEGNLNNPDPIWTTTTVARNHGLMIWDMLYALDDSFAPKPQMAAGHTVSDDRLTWRFTLRDGLIFHDGAPVRSIDCITSIIRWAKRRPLGQKLLELTADMKPIDDKTFEIRLTKPYPLMTYTLSDWCFIMPERIAKTDPFKQITEFVGSGPFRFERDQWVAGSLAVYTRFDKYQPRTEPPSFAAGGKVARFDRVEWRIIPDASTAVAALKNGEVDWIQQPTFDLLPLLRKSEGVKVAVNDPLGVVGMLGINHLHPPFDNPKLRRALLSAIDQKDFMEAALGAETSLYHLPSGVFTPGTPMASDAGLSVFTAPRDLAHSKQLVAESGYKGEPIILLSPSDYPVQQAFAQVAADLMKKLGMNVVYASVDWGTLVQRRTSKAPPDKGGWSIFPTTYEGLTVSNPGSNFPMRGNGDGAWFGWPTDPAMEALRDRWFEAPDEAAQKKIAAEMQVLTFENVPFIPLGQLFYATAYRTDIRGLVDASCPIFWSVHKA
jgi:peptide/nickel transport system substrate-binding protein